MRLWVWLTGALAAPLWLQTALCRTRVRRPGNAPFLLLYKYVRKDRPETRSTHSKNENFNHVLLQWVAIPPFHVKQSKNGPRNRCTGFLGLSGAIQNGRGTNQVTPADSGALVAGACHGVSPCAMEPMAAATPRNVKASVIA